MTAGHNALRGSGPGQNPAFDDALALSHPFGGGEGRRTVEGVGDVSSRLRIGPNRQSGAGARDHDPGDERLAFNGRDSVYAVVLIAFGNVLCGAREI